MRTPSLRFKLTFFYTAIFAALLAAMFAGAYYLLRSDLERVARDELIERASALRGYFHFEDGKPVLPSDESDVEVASFIRTATRYMQIYDLTTGELVTQSAELRLRGLSFTQAELGAIARGPALIDVSTDAGRIWFVNDRLSSDSGRVFFLQVGEPLEPFDAALRRFGRLVLLLLPFGILLAGISGYVMAGRVLSPIRTIARTAQEIEVAHLDRRLQRQHNNDDLDRLAGTFNDMLDRLESAVNEMKQFTASIAHELRTPLTALRGEAELALLQGKTLEDYRSLIGSQLEEFDKLARLINQLLMLARAESGELPLNHKLFDVVSLLRDVAESFSPIAAEKDISIHFEPPPSMEIYGDAQWIERAVVNLLDNAIKYTHRGGRVELLLSQVRGESLIEVRDNGGGISDAALPHIFERFYRADPSRGKEIEGVGLGLSLVKWIVDQHSGKIDVRSNGGQGTGFTIRLPLPDASHIKQV